MTDIEIGRAKRARRAYSFDDIAVVPSRRTRDPEVVSLAWGIDALKFEIPVIAAPMDSVVSPETAIAIGRLGGLGVLDLEGLWTRYEDAAAQTQLPIGTLKSRLSRGRSRLRDMLEGSNSGTGRGGQQRDVRVAVRP